MKPSARFAACMAAGVVLLGACTETPQTPNAEAPPNSPASESAATTPKGLDAEAEQAWIQWHEQGFNDYSYRLGLSCFCPRVSVQVIVKDGRVVQVGNGPEGDSKTFTAFGGLEPTIDNAFVMLGQAQRAADEVTVSFDEATGMPTNIYVDPSSNGSDDEVGYDLDDFTASTA